MIAGKAIQAVTAAWLTRLAGKSFITYFSQQQTWGDGGIGEVVRRQYDLDRRDLDLSRFLEQALAKVVEPLRRDGACRRKGLRRWWTQWTLTIQDHHQGQIRQGQEHRDNAGRDGDPAAAGEDSLMGLGAPQQSAAIRAHL